MSGMRIEDIQHRGRWKSIDSLRRSVQLSEALLMAQVLPEHVGALGAMICDHVLLSYYFLSPIFNLVGSGPITAPCWLPTVHYV